RAGSAPVRPALRPAGRRPDRAARPHHAVAARHAATRTTLLQNAAPQHRLGDSATALSPKWVRTRVRPATHRAGLLRPRLHGPENSRLSPGWAGRRPDGWPNLAQLRGRRQFANIRAAIAIGDGWRDAAHWAAVRPARRPRRRRQPGVPAAGAWRRTIPCCCAHTA